MFKQTLTLGALVLAAGSAFAQSNEPPADRPGGKPAVAGEEVAVLQVPQGTIVFRFFEADAPKTVANFKKLARSSFYDGTTFHRLVPGFVIQGGDPLSKDNDLNNDGTGSSGTTIPGEFSPAHKHVRGTVSMARSMDPNSASCQFFICLAPAPSLDGKYAAFGQVVQGMDVVDKIAALASDPSVKQGAMGANPGKKAVMTKVTIEPYAKWTKPAGKAVEGKFTPAKSAPKSAEVKPAEPAPAAPAAPDSSKR
jgi:cyclophilin family peptidyl-prolyl cis-trans isomerase